MEYFKTECADIHSNHSVTNKITAIMIKKLMIIIIIIIIITIIIIIRTLYVTEGFSTLKRI